MGYIIERISNMSYEEFLNIYFFKPLKMYNTGFGNHEKILPKRAAGFISHVGEFLHGEYHDFSVADAAGALYSTIGDLNKWIEAYKSKKY